MRNILVHGYFRVDLTAVWRTIHGNLPSLLGNLIALAVSVSAGDRA